MRAVLCLSLCLSVAAQEPTPQAATVTLRGRTTTWQREPIGSVCLAVMPADTFDTSVLLREPALKSGADGKFTMTVPVQAKGARDQVLHIAAAGRNSVAIPLELQAHEDGKSWEQDLGDVVLGEGGRLLGRVRTAEGRPLAGARVTASDLLARGFQVGEVHMAACATVTGADGIFDLPCALGQAAWVDCSADGYFRRRLHPVATGTPLEIDLQPSGFLAGRLLDAEGRGVEGAWVSVAYELAGESLGVARYAHFVQEWAGERPDAVRTAKDGSFRCSRSAPGRYRVRAWVEPQAEGRGHQAAHSPVAHEANESLELRLTAPPDSDAKPASLRVRAVDKASGQPVTAFTAVSVFEEYATQSPPYLDQQLRERMRNPHAAKEGEARVPGPREGEPPMGAVRVLARGRAVATREKVEWQQPGDGEPEPLVTVELVPEATLQGRVVDETTGAPLASVRVWCTQALEAMLGAHFPSGMPPDAALTGPDGSFTISNLGEGVVEVHAQLQGRPPLDPTDVKLAAAEKRTGVELKFGKGAAVTLRIAGMPEATSGRVVLGALGAGDSPFMYSDFGGMMMETEPAMASNGPGEQFSARADASGRFRFQGVPAGNYMASLELPTEPRTGVMIQAQVEPFRVRRSDLERELDASEDRPATVSGKVTFPHAAVPADRLLAVLHPATSGFEHPWAMAGGYRHALVARDGTFRLRAAPGRYRLRLVDLATLVELWSTGRPFELKPGATLEVSPAPTLGRVRVQLAAAEAQQGFACNRLEVRVVTPMLRMSGVWQGNEEWDSGRGVEVQAGQTEVELLVPAGLVVVLARSNAAHLMLEGDHDALRRPLGRVEFEVTAGEAETRARVEVAPPPEIPEPSGG